jgi:TonB family protein
VKGAAWLVLAVAACAGSRPTRAPVPQPQLVAPQSPAASTAPADDDETVLHTRPWKYGPYFTRLKRQVNAAWNPLDVWKAFPEARRTSLGTALRETVVGVELSAEGKITKLELSQSSGVAELDAEGLRAFQASSPFGATPDGEQLKPFSFAFRFEIGAGTTSMTVAP